MNPKYLRIDLDQPYTVALKYPAPVIVNGFAGKECRWMLANGQTLYTPLDLRQQIEAFKPGQSFTIQKVRVGRSIEWKVRRANAEESQATKERPVERLKQQPIASILERSDSLDCPSYEIPSSRLDDALRTAVSAAAAAEKHGASIGYSIRFRPEDVRAMAISVLIGMEQNRRAA